MARFLGVERKDGNLYLGGMALCLGVSGSYVAEIAGRAGPLEGAGLGNGRD